MLEENGDNLPGFLLYQRLPTTSRMSQIISKLYAAVTEFLLWWGQLAISPLWAQELSFGVYQR
jgi:hypothetical protein